MKLYLIGLTLTASTIISGCSNSSSDMDLLLGTLAAASGVAIAKEKRSDRRYNLRTTEPARGTLPYLSKVYIKNSYRCESGKILQITGGNLSRGIPRKYRCFNP